jgi:hypothetical protein
MKRFFPLLLFLIAPAAHAGYTHKVSTVVSGAVDGAYSHAKRIGSSYQFQSDGLTISALGGLTGPASSDGTLTGVAATYGTNTFTHSGTGSASLTESFIQGDTVPTQTGLAVGSTTGATASLLTMGDTVSYSGGNRTNQAVALTQAGGITLTPGSSGTSVTGSITSLIEVH